MKQVEKVLQIYNASGWEGLLKVECENIRVYSSQEGLYTVDCKTDKVRIQTYKPHRIGQLLAAKLKRLEVQNKRKEKLFTLEETAEKKLEELAVTLPEAFRFFFTVKNEKLMLVMTYNNRQAPQNNTVVTLNTWENTIVLMYVRNLTEALKKVISVTDIDFEEEELQNERKPKEKLDSQYVLPKVNRDLLVTLLKAFDLTQTAQKLSKELCANEEIKRLLLLGCVTARKNNQILKTELGRYAQVIVSKTGHTLSSVPEEFGFRVKEDGKKIRRATRKESGRKINPSELLAFDLSKP